MNASKYSAPFGPSLKAMLAIGGILTLLSISPLYGEEAQEKPANGGGSVKVDPSPLERSPGSLTSFAPIVEKVAPSVVTVFSTKTVHLDRSLAPSLDNEFLRRFFGFGGNGDENPAPRTEKSQALGSGVVVSADGLIVTNNHVIEGADDIEVSLASGEKKYKAKKLGTDPGTDIAVLKIDAQNLPAATFADSDKARVGDIVLAIGNPFALTQTVTMGIISALGRGELGIVDYENFIQTDASINPGNSGGALVDVMGRVVGINTAIFSRSGGNQGIGFAVPSNLAREVFESIRKNGRVVRGYLGTRIQSVTPELAKAFKVPASVEGGALVSEVTPGSPAEKAGMKPGDVIIGLNGKKVLDPRQLRLAVGELSPGTKAEVKIVREGQEQTVTVDLGELPSTSDRNPRGGGDENNSSPQGSHGKPNALDGITIENLDEAARRELKTPAEVQGAVITSIDPNSAGYAAGLRQGDIITGINHKPVKDARDAMEIGDQIEKNETVLLRVYSHGGNHYVVVPPKAAE